MRIHTAAYLLRWMGILMTAMMVDSGLGLTAPLFPNRQFSADPASYDILVADFNRDGKPDLAVATPVTGDVSVFLGLGSDSFAPKLSLPVGVGPEATSANIAVGDFNGDGSPDIAAANFDEGGGFQAPDDVSILLGRGDGTFAPEVRIPVGNGPRALAAADLNGDGLDDLVVPNSDNVQVNTLTILVSRGDGTFASQTRPVGPYPLSVAAGDFNGDQRVDLAVTGGLYDAYLMFLFGNGDGTFSTGSTFTLPELSGFQPGVADFNRDGVSDLVQPIGNYGSGGAVYLGSRSGSITPVGNLLTYCCSATPVIGDFDGDARLDVADGLKMYLGNGDGTFRSLPQTIFSGAGGGSPTAAADFNADGHLDIAVGGTNTVYLGKGDGTFPVPQRSFAPYISPLVVTGDFNSDGEADLAWGSGDSVNVSLGTGQGLASAQPSIRLGGEIRSVAVGDFNRDSRQDLVAVDHRALQFTTEYDAVVLLGAGDGTFSSPTRIRVGTAPVHVIVADFNGDQRNDIATVNEGSHDVSILLGAGDGSFASASSVPTGTMPRFIAAGDLNDDGLIDLAVANFESADVSILVGSGDGTFQPQVRFAAGYYPASLAMADFNADGTIDLAVSNDLPYSTAARFPDSISVLYGTSSGGFTAPIVLTSVDGPSPVIAGDFDGDGRTDLGVAYTHTNTLAIFLNDGAGLASAQLFAVWPDPLALIAVDFTDDGCLDLLVTSGLGVSSTIVALVNQSQRCHACSDADGDGWCDASDNCPATANADQMDADGDGVGDACDPCPVLPNITECIETVVASCVSFTSPLGKGSGTISWRTQFETDLAGFNVITIDQQERRTALNPVVIPCEECITASGHLYTFLLPKHKGGHDIFVEMVRQDGLIETFGPAVKNCTP